MEQRNFKGDKKRNRLLTLKMDFNYQISQRNKKVKQKHLKKFSQIGVILSKKGSS